MIFVIILLRNYFDKYSMNLPLIGTHVCDSSEYFVYMVSLLKSYISWRNIFKI